MPSGPEDEQCSSAKSYEKDWRQPVALFLNVRLRQFAIITAVKYEIRGRPSLKYAA
jgi:hypothetical protein